MKKWLFITCVAFSALLSCSREPEMEVIDPKEDGGKKVTISFSLPGFAPETKASLGEGGELNTLHLAVFGGSDYLKEYVQADPTVTTDYTYWSTDKDGNPESHQVPNYNYTVTLALSESRRTVHFLGNGPDILPFGYDTSVMPIQLNSNGEMGYWQMIELPKGIRAKRDANDNYIDKYGHLIPDDDGYYPTRPLQEGDWWQDADRGKTRYVADAATEAAFQNITLVRNWAKIVLTATEDSNFTPYSLAAVNVPSRGSLVPYSPAKGFISKTNPNVLKDYQECSFPDLEDTFEYPGNLPSGTIFDNTKPAKEDFEFFKGSEQTIMRNGVANANGGAVYLYERPSPTASIPPSFVIIYGHYRNEDDLEHECDCFYKVDLMEVKKVGEGDDMQWISRYYPIYRNFKYQVVIKKILAQGHATPEAAASSAGSADVSADITTSHLADISDGLGRLHIMPWMAKTFTREHDAEHPVTELSVFFSQTSDGEADMDPASVTVERLAPEDGGTDIIGIPTLGDPYDPSQHENPDLKRKGWRTVSFTTAAAGRTVRSQTIRITGTHEFGRLYRDVIITIQPIQPMLVTCGYERIAAAKGSSQNVTVSIPDGLVESMFPLEFVLEPQDKSLSPDNSVKNNNLPVIWKESISTDEGYAGKPTFQFVKTISWEDYMGLPRYEDEEERMWRSFTCHFITNCDENATKIWVYNEFFDKKSAQFTNFRYKFFQNLGFSIPFSADENIKNKKIPLHFEMVEDPDLVYPISYPVITIAPYGLILEGEGVTPGPDPGTYYFHPESHSVDLTFTSVATSPEDISVDLTANEYSPGHTRVCHFINAGLLDGHPLSAENGAKWSDKTWSNVAWGHVNRDGNKTILLGYKDDPAKLNTPVTVTITSGLKEPKVFGQAIAFPYAPPVRHSTSDEGYHEIEFRTIEGTRDVIFSMSSPGYVTESFTLGRFIGNIRTMRITSGNAFKKGNTYGFTKANPSFEYAEDNGKVKVEFSDISADPNGYVLFDEGGTYTLTITSLNSNQTLFYVDLIFDTSTGTVQCPESFTPSVGTIERYPGSNNQYVWSIPRGNLSASTSFKVPDGRKVRLNTMYIKSMNGTLYRNGIAIP